MFMFMGVVCMMCGEGEGGWCVCCVWGGDVGVCWGGGGWGSVLVWVVPFLGVRGIGGRIIPVVGVLIVLGAMCTFGLVFCVSRSLVVWWRVVRFWRVRFPGEG